MKKKLSGLVLVTAAIFLIIAALIKTGKDKPASVISLADLSRHPIYSTYRFDNTDNVVNIGTQPFYMPTGLITETMKHDVILKEAMKEHDVEVRFFPFLKGHDVNFFMLRGDLDAGVGGDMPAISLASDMDIIIPALIQQGFVSIVASRHMLVNELRGKRIGYAYGSNAHYTLLNTLSAEGLDESMVDLIPMEVSEMPEALFKGRIDAFSAWEPAPSITLISYPDKVIIHRSLSTGYLYFNKTLYDNHPDIMRLILAAEIRALRWIQADRQNLLKASQWTIDESGRLTDMNMVLSENKIAGLAMKDITGRAFPPVIPESDLAQSGRIYKEFIFLNGLGKIPHSGNWEKVRDSFDLQILKSVLAEPAAYRLNEFIYDVQGGGNED